MLYISCLLFIFQCRIKEQYHSLEDYSHVTLWNAYVILIFTIAALNKKKSKGFVMLWFSVANVCAEEKKDLWASQHLYLQVQAEITTKHMNTSDENTLYFRSSEKPTTLLTKDLMVVHQSPTFYLFLYHFFLFPFHLFPCPACNVHNSHTLSQGLSVNNPCKNTFCQLQPRRAVS